jgi:hypothetical protein
MKLRDDDKKWLSDEIARQLKEVIDALKPHGWHKLAHLLRQLGPIIGSCAFVLALFAAVITLGIFATNRISQESEFRGSTQVRLTNIEGRLGGIETNLLALRAAQAASLPTDKKNIAEAKAILNTAKQSATKLPADVVEQSGKAFIDAAAKEPASWTAALDFINYRSSMVVYTRDVKTVDTSGGMTNFNLGPTVSGKPVPKLSHIPLGVAPKDAARFETIGQNLNEHLQFGTSQLILTGGAISLDDKYVRHVLFIGVEVHYTGKPLILQDAVFASCTFIFDNTQLGRELGRVLLASSPVNFEKTS